MTDFDSKTNDDEEEKGRLTEDQVARLKNQFNRYKNSQDSLLPSGQIERCIDTSKLNLREGERKRTIELAKMVTEGSPGIGWETLFSLANGFIDVNTLHILFNAANTDTALERVEFYLDVDEIFNLMKKIGVDKSKDDIEAELDKLDKDSDGRCDWEEFLTVATQLLGSSVNVNKNDPDGTDFNQLRDSTTRMKDNLILTRKVVRDYDKAIIEKKKEIEKRIKDTTLDDIKKRLKKEWDMKDKLEMKLLDNKMDHYKVMAKTLTDNDQEKAELIQRFHETCRQRNQIRSDISAIRASFKQRFQEKFVSMGDVQGTLDEINKASKSVQEGLNTAKQAAKDAHKIWETTSSFEKNPIVSQSSKGLEFLTSQNAVMSEIMTKMKMMQRERDKYEDMIEEEMQKNKTKRIECVNMNMKITNLETQQMSLQAKCRDLEIQNLTLAEEWKKKSQDTDSKKVKELKNTVFQFKEERDAIVEQVEDIRSKLRHVDKMYVLAKKKAAQLNIELGELKILLEGMKDLGNDEADFGYGF